MTIYNVDLIAVANCECTITIEAETREEAEKLALEKVNLEDFKICEFNYDIEVNGVYSTEKGCLE